MVEVTLKDEVAIVTGAGRGFGKAIAKGLAAAGAAVTVTSRSIGELDDTVLEINKAGGRAFAVAGDVTHRRDVARVVSVAQNHFGAATLLVNNAGLAGPYGPLHAVDPDEWWDAQSVHLRGPLLYVNAVLHEMIGKRRGRIINVASLGGTRVQPNLSAYCMGKAAQIRFTEHIAAEGAAHGIVAFAIEPGTVYTQMAEHTISSPAAQKWLPEMVATLKEIKARDDPRAGFARCAQRCVELASGKFDALSGRYLTPDDDLQHLVQRVRTS